MLVRFLGDMASGPGAALVLLMVGHVLGDFLFQSAWMAREKERRTGPLVLHALVMLVVHAVVLAPLWSGRVAVGLVLLAASHLIFDALRIKAFGRWGSTLGAFFLDQTLHVLAVGVLWAVLSSARAFHELHVVPSGEWLAWYARWAAVAAGYVFVGKGGTRIVRGVLERFPEAVPSAEADGNEYAMGQMIGYLERYVAVTLVLLGQWAALGLIIAAKSIARFPEFTRPEHKDFAEYYLLGTLTSILVAVGVGAVTRLLFL